MKNRTSKEKVTNKSDRYLLFINEYFSQVGYFPFFKNHPSPTPDFCCVCVSKI